MELANVLIDTVYVLIDQKPMICLKRLVFVEAGRLEWEDAPAPVLHGPKEAIVRPLIMGRCDLDVLYVSGRMPLARGEPIGHEIIGEIVELGSDAEHIFQIGQVVIVPAQISCGTCRMCRAGETGRCESVPLGASYGMGREGGFGGGLSELVRVPFATGMLVPLPQHTDHLQMIGLADMATDAWRAVGPQLLARPGGSVLVIGGATPVIGIYAAGLARCLGADRVVYIDADQERRKTADAYKVETAEQIEDVDQPHFDVVVDAASSQKALMAAFDKCGPGAQLTSVAPPFTSPELPLFESYHKGLTYQLARPNCRHGHGPALHAWGSCGFRPELINTKTFTFDNADKAWLDPSLHVAVTRS